MGIILSRNGSEESGDGRFGDPEGVKGLTVSRRDIAVGGEVGERGAGVEVSGAGWGVVTFGATMF